VLAVAMGHGRAKTTYHLFQLPTTLAKVYAKVHQIILLLHIFVIDLAMASAKILEEALNSIVLMAVV